MKRRSSPRAALLALCAVIAGASPGAAQSGSVPQSFQRGGFNSLISVAWDGSQSDATSADANITPDGRFIAFFSDASNLVPNDDNGMGDVFLRDRIAGTTERISISAEGGDADQMSMQPSISDDGRYVAFMSYATNLTSETGIDPLFAEVFVRDRTAGTTTRVTRGLDGGIADFGALAPAISFDGSRIAFHSTSTNLIEGDTNGKADIFVWEAATDSIERVSLGIDGAEGDGSSTSPNFSPDGGYLAFNSVATNLIEDDTNGSQDVFLTELDTNTIEMVSVASDETLANEDSFSPVIALSDQASLVAFQSAASNLVPNDTNGTSNVNHGVDIFVRDRDAGTTERVSLTSSGGELVKGLGTSMSADGRYIAFTALKPGADPTDFVAPADAWLHDRVTGRTELISATRNGDFADGEAENPKVSADGRYVFFQTGGDTFAPGDDNELTDVVMRDRVADLGVLDLGLKGTSNNRMLTGRAVFPGIVIEDVGDPVEPTDFSALGADLTGVSISYRRDTADLLVRLKVNELPSASVKAPPAVVSGMPAVAAGGAPALIHGVAFSLAGDRFEARAMRVAGTRVPPTTPSFSLHICDTICNQGLPIDGGYGTAGNEIRIAIPAALMGLQPGEELTDIQAYSSVGEHAPGSIQRIDTAALSSFALPDSTVQLGIADPAAHAEQVAFDITSSFGGDFGFPLAELPWQGKALWTRACLGDVCSSAQRL